MEKKFVITLVIILFINLNLITPSFSITNSITPTNNKTAKDHAAQPVLSIVETKLDSNSSKAGEEFNAKIMENIFYDGQVIIPKNSMASGKIIKVKKAGKLSKDAYIKVEINRFIMPDGKIIPIVDKPMFIDILNPNTIPKKGSFFKRLPGTLANSTTSLLLNNYSSAARVAVWGISTGAGIAAGMVSGVIFPDKDKTRAESSTQGAINATPIGTVNTILKKGEDINFYPGQYICIFFDTKTVEYIKQNIPYS